MKRLILLALTALIFLSLAGSSTATLAQQSRGKAAQVALTTLLEKTGYSYKKISDGVYEVPATGTNIKEFPLRLVQAGDLILVIYKIADRKDVSIREEFAVKLLELNDNYDVVKFALSAEMLYTRIDMHARVVDAEELKYLIELSAQVVDEAYPQLKPFIAGAKQ